MWNSIRTIVCTAIGLILLLGFRPAVERSELSALSQQKVTNMSLLNKSLPEIKKAVKGKWSLISGENSIMAFEFDNTVIEFDGDNYSWTDEDGTEKGGLNWRRTPSSEISNSGEGVNVYLMDVFYEENPSYPVAIKNDTLFIQDVSENRYLYKLVRK